MLLNQSKVKLNRIDIKSLNQFENCIRKILTIVMNRIVATILIFKPRGGVFNKPILSREPKDIFEG